MTEPTNSNRRRAVPRLLAAALTALLLAVGVGGALDTSASAATPARPGAATTLQGTIVAGHQDPGTAGQYLQVGARLYLIKPVASLNLHIGDRVELSGTLSGPSDAPVIEAQSARALTTSVPPSAPAPLTRSAPRTPTGSGARSVLVILVDWTQPDGVTAAQAQNQVGVTDTQWYQQVSYGQFAGWTATTIGWSSIPVPPIDCSNGMRANIQAGGNAAASNAGLNIANFNVVMYYFPWVNCGWGGWAIGNLVWINGSMNTATTAHELGHTLGLGHGHSYVCSDSAGHPVALSGSCQINEYGDGFDVMGCCASGSLTAVQKYDLGWMSGREQDLSAAAANSTHTYSLAPLESSTQALQGLRIVGSSETLWLEYRQPVGVDSWISAYPGAINGVTIHLQTGDSLGYTQLGSYLLDMTPGSTSGFVDPALPAGATWVDPSGQIQITVNSATSTGSGVTVVTRNPPFINVYAEELIVDGLHPHPVSTLLEVDGSFFTPGGSAKVTVTAGGTVLYSGTTQADQFGNFLVSRGARRLACGSTVTATATDTVSGKSTGVETTSVAC